MRDHIVWGFYIVNFVYFIGASYSAAGLAAILYYMNVSWAKPVIRVATLVAFICGVIGPVFILLCIGRFDRIHYLFLHARVQSPITWDVLVISTYLVGISIFTYLIFFKDFAKLRDVRFKEKPTWRNKLYSTLSIGYHDSDKQKEILGHAIKSMSFILVPKVILAFAVLSWIFGMTIRPGMHSSIFGPSYIISSAATSIGLIILIMWIYRKLFKMESYFTDLQFYKLSIIMLVLVCIYGYFTFTEYITIWYSSGTWESNLIKKYLGWGNSGWMFHIANFFGIVLVIFVLFFKRLRTPSNITIVSLLLVVAMWVRRYLLVVPTLENTLLPMQDSRPDFIQYTPTWVEWALVVAGAATFALFFTVIPRLLTIKPFDREINT